MPYWEVYYYLRYITNMSENLNQIYNHKLKKKNSNKNISMGEEINRLLSQIDLEIDEIDLYGYDIIPISLSMVHRLQDILTNLRNQLQTYVFSSKEEEISFFKKLRFSFNRLIDKA